MSIYWPRIVQAVAIIGVVAGAAACDPEPGSPVVVGTTTSTAVDFCAPQRIVQDLNVEQWLQGATATVKDCTGSWAQISWDVRGDNARIVYRGDTPKWKDYVRFPHNVCWAQAQADGAPADYKKYFSVC